MNTYLIPLYNTNTREPFIESVSAKSISEAQDRFIEEWIDEDSEIPGDWYDFIDVMYENGFILGEFKEISEF